MVKLQLLGIGCRKSKALRANVLEALKALPKEITLEEITDVDRIMTFDISAAPALLVNGKVIFQDTVPGVEEIKTIISRVFQGPHRAFDIRRILVPIDFSETSKGAFLYAQAFAAQFQASIKVVHVYHPEFDHSAPLLTSPFTNFDETKREMLERFVKENTLTNNGNVSTLVDIERELLVGFPAEEILHKAQQEDFDLLIMGTTGQGGFLEKVFGSVSIKVSQNGHLPVLLIPNQVEYRDVKRILYASKYQPAAEVVIRRVADMTKRLKASVHFVHVQENESNGYHVDEKELSQLFREASSDQPFKIVTVTGSSVNSGLNQYARENQIDLLVLGTEHRSFFEKLVHRSITKRLLLNAKLPMLVFHFDSL